MRATLSIILITIALSFAVSFVANAFLASDNVTSYTQVNIPTNNTDQYVKHAIVGNHYSATHYNVRNHKEKRNPYSAINTLDSLFNVPMVR